MRSAMRDLERFHRQFGLVYEGPPRELEGQLKTLREDRLLEEAREYAEATTLEERLDALVDVIYIALGNAQLHGFTRFDEAWRRVHAANMLKVRAQSAGDSRHGSTFDIVKPHGWQPPVLSDLVQPTTSPRLFDPPRQWHGLGAILIIEGPDGAGKTTLIGSLVALLSKRFTQVHVRHHGPYHGESEVWPQYVLSLNHNPGDLVILDRSWISEPIYGRVFRGGANRVGDTSDFLDRAAANFGAVVVRCLPPLSVVTDVIRRRGDAMVDVETIKAVWLEYAEPLRTTLPVINYDWLLESPTGLLARIEARR